LWEEPEDNKIQKDFCCPRPDTKREIAYKGIAQAKGRNELFTTVYDKMSSEFEDSLWCNVNLENSNQLLVSTVYQSPSSNKENNENLLELLYTTAHQYGMERLVIIGDFNPPEIGHRR